MRTARVALLLGADECVRPYTRPRVGGFRKSVIPVGSDSKVDCVAPDAFVRGCAKRNEVAVVVTVE